MREPRGVPFGMYAEVVRPGRIQVGDPVAPMPAVTVAGTDPAGG